jgi:hypothetical protein
MPTEREVHELKMEWRNDPTFVLEDQPGFEDHKQELIDYRRYWEAIWAERRVYKADPTADPELIAVNMGIPGNRILSDYIYKLHLRIEKLEKTLYDAQ